MKQVQLKELSTPLSPRTTEDSIYPNIDSTYTVVPYSGERLAIHTNENSLGIKVMNSLATNKQGMAIYGNLLIRMANDSVSTTHIIYELNDIGVASQVATFTLSGVGHSNALQFAPIVESSKTYPYLYVAALDGVCHVLEISANYSVSKVQTITIPNTSQVLIGDDGYIWSSTAGNNNSRHFCKYRRVAISEGDITLGDSDIIDEWDTNDVFPSDTYTAQGWKIKFGKIWFCYGAAGAGQNRGVRVFDTTTHAKVADIDLSDYTTVEFEDVDFWDNAMIIAAISGQCYILRF